MYKTFHFNLIFIPLFLSKFLCNNREKKFFEIKKMLRRNIQVYKRVIRTINLEEINCNSKAVYKFTQVNF